MVTHPSLQGPEQARFHTRACRVPGKVPHESLQGPGRGITPDLQFPLQCHARIFVTKNIIFDFHVLDMFTIERFLH